MIENLFFFVKIFAVLGYSYIGTKADKNESRYAQVCLQNGKMQTRWSGCHPSLSSKWQNADKKEQMPAKLVFKTAKCGQERE
ncbi:hypothetical protein ACNQFZ_15990 [Schinkia sp. CFF1]